ncbi:hypothetical protein B0H14DRAFT_2614881 [Mycena olivaceomarginata]|nr:hypothetical protein B0H14DRAFT_2614881 [Mycena olivaceomarginata]
MLPPAQSMAHLMCLLISAVGLHLASSMSEPSILLPSKYDTSSSFKANDFFAPPTNQMGTTIDLFIGFGFSLLVLSVIKLTSHSPSSYPSPSIQDRSQRNVIAEICSAEISDFETLQAKAECTMNGDRSSSLASFACCFHAMEKIILGLELDPGNLKSSCCFTLHNGQKIKLIVSEVLNSACFRWKGSTFSKKQPKYKLAKSIALWNWKGRELCSSGLLYPGREEKEPVERSKGAGDSGGTDGITDIENTTPLRCSVSVVCRVGSGTEEMTKEVTIRSPNGGGAKSEGSGGPETKSRDYRATPK